MPPKVDKIEAEIRKLAKLDGNKTCADCPEKIPGYVDLTHNVFVCTKCSGIHREFQYKIKGVSMAVFTAEDVAGLSSMGNELFNSIYLARLNPREYILPNGNDVNKLKEFIKKKYVDKIWHRDTASSSSIASPTTYERAKAAEKPIESATIASPPPSTEPSTSTNKIAIKLNRPNAATIASRRSSTGSYDLPQKKTVDVTSGMDLLSLSDSVNTNNYDPFAPAPATSAVTSDPFASPVKQHTHDDFDAFGSTENASSSAFDAFGTSSSSVPAQSNAFDPFSHSSASTTAFDPFGEQPTSHSTQSNGFDAFHNTPAKPVHQGATSHHDFFGSSSQPPIQTTIKLNPPAPAPAPAPTAASNTPPQPVSKDFGAFDDLVNSSLSAPSHQPAPAASNPFDSLHQVTGPATTQAPAPSAAPSGPPTHYGGYPAQSGYPAQGVPPAYGYGYGANPYGQPTPGYGYPPNSFPNPAAGNPYGAAPQQGYYAYPPQAPQPYGGHPAGYGQPPTPSAAPAPTAAPAAQQAPDPFAAMSSMAWSAAGRTAPTATAAAPSNSAAAIQPSFTPAPYTPAAAPPSQPAATVNPFDLF